MHIIYKITYRPHIGTSHPKYYIGSKYNWKGNYLGSVSSKRKFEFTNGLTLKQWWKNQTANKDNFLFEIIESYVNITPSELVEKERAVQQELGVISEEYFNQCIAAGGFVSVKKDLDTKKLLSEKTKQFWQTPAGIEKRKRLSERNRKTKSAELKNKWQNDPVFAKKAIEAASRPNTELHNQRISDGKLTSFTYKGKVYRGWAELQEQTGVTKHLYKKYYINGYEPEVNIGLKHPVLVLLKDT